MRVFVRSFGCSSSMADGEVLAGCLRSAGFELVQSLAEAEVVVYNTCGVKAPTENKIIHLLKQVPADKRLIVAGCLPLINFSRLNQEVRFDAAVGPAFGEGIVGVVKRVLDGERVMVVDSSSGFKPSLGLPRVRVNPVIGIIPITSGCVGECSYCCVRFARGKLQSVGIDEVKKYVGNCLSKGVREFWLTGQDVACYGLDVGGNVVDVLRSVCGVDGFEEFWMRLGMMTPNLLMPMLDDLCGFLSRQGPWACFSVSAHTHAEW